MKIIHSPIPYLVLLAASPVAAQVPADSVLRDFEPAGAYAVELGGETLDRAEVLRSEHAAAFLILAPELDSPVLLSPRNGAVEGVDPTRIDRQADGSIDLLADVELTPLGSFEIDAATREVRFQLDGTPASLKPKPSLTGMQPAESLELHNPAYAYKAAGYEAAPASLAKLREHGRDVRVRVYFGSWCPVCSRLVPRILRVDREVDSSAIRFEYYGLPQPLTEDPIAEKEGIHGVPTVVIYVEGKERARLSSPQLAAPEQTLADALGV